jgi:hypothetical protein
MPDVRIWLDIDNIQQSSGNLELAVGQAAVFILFHSEGYFASNNCRREINEAIRLKRRVIFIYEGNERVFTIRRGNPLFVHL